MRRSGRGVRSVLLASVLAAAGCGGGQTTSGAETADVRVGVVFGPGDRAFNAAAAAGLDRAEQEFGIEKREVEGESREELVRLLAEDGHDLVLGVGASFSGAVGAVAPDFPASAFGVVDSAVEQPDVASLAFAEEEGSYLVGAAAALTSKTGRIGFIGVEGDATGRAEAGYAAGARKAKPAIRVDVRYVARPTGPADPAEGKEVALGQYGAGADVVYAAAGLGAGPFQAAKEVSERTGTKVWAIGVGSDQADVVAGPLKPYVLTSMLKRADVAVYETVKRIVEGGEASGVTTFDLEAGGVDYSTTGGFVDPIRDDLDDLKRRIVDGKIEVPSAPEG